MGFTFEQHKKVGAQLKRIHRELESLFYEILRAYPPPPNQPKNQPIEISDIDKVGVAAAAKVRELQYSVENCMFNENRSRSPEELEGIYLAGKSLGRIPMSREPAFSESSVKSGPKMNIGVNPNLRKNSNLMKSMTDSYTISKFVEHLRENGYPSLKVDRWPDKENSTTPDIDAIAGPFAIEHTSIDTFLNQRKYNDWFDRVIGTLESELVGQLPYKLEVRFEQEVFTQKHNWKAIHKALKRFVLDGTSNLGWGCHEFDNILGIPFTVYVEKSNQHPFRLTFERGSPNEAKPRGLFDKWRPPLPDGFREQLDKKAKKLVQYKACGKTTTLLIESVDVAFMNPGKMLDWIKKAYPNGLPDGVNRIWYAARFNSEFIFKNFTLDIKKGT